MATLPKGFVPDPDQELPPGFVPDDAAPDPLTRQLKNTGPIEDVRASLGNRQWNPDIGTGVAAPSLSLIDKYTMGGLTGAMRASLAAGRAVGLPNEDGLVANSLEAIQRYRESEPTLSQYTDLPAYLMRGPMTAIAKESKGLVDKALRPLGPAQRAVAGAGVAGGVIGGAQAATSGATPGEALEGIGEGAAMGGGIATPLAIGGRALGRAAASVIGSKGGKAREFIESKGRARVGLTTPGKGGAFDDMVTQGSDDAAIGQQAEVSGKRGLEMLGQEKRGVLGVAGKRIGRIGRSEEGARLRDVSDLVTKVEAALDDIDISDQAEQSLVKALAKVKKTQGAGFNPETDPYLLSETDLNKLRRRLDRAAKTGISNDEALHPLRQAANDARAMVNEGPFKEANEIYSRESKFFQKSRRKLGITERPKGPEETKTAEDKVVNLITRRGQNTVTAGKQQRDLQEFKERHPDIGAEFEKPELLRKRADISFRLLPQKHGGLIERTGSGMGGLAIAEAAMQLLGHGHVSPWKAAGALGTGLAAQNLPAIQARLLYGPAVTAGELSPLFLNEVPLLSAVRNQYGEHR